MIELIQVSKTFNSATPQQIAALKPINLNLPAQSFTVVVGSNGSGKSTLLNAIAGSIDVKGMIKIDGQDVTALAEYERSRLVARLFQNPLTGTAADLTVIENFRLAYLRTQSKKPTVGINETFVAQVASKVSMLELGLENKLHQKMGSLSGGQRQALTLVMAVMAPSAILLMDEPTAALDPNAAKILMQSAQQLIEANKLTALMVTHNLKDAYTYGNCIIQMHDGYMIKQLNQTEKHALKPADLYNWFM
ncbi:MAG: ATP-binding cassette domain-containing protein [Bacteroidia bacterium]|nr:ATP-binding cassette domain-containing protein [Bacteroidia bacterium]HQU99559.1 ATP-binding cassette domain-containing protein [Bacteroidia bacterium]